jgi:hypothetical protein
VRLNGVGGLVSVISLGIVFVVALFFASHYWQEQKRPRIGQIKKRRLRRIMCRWVWVAIAACAIGLAGSGVYYLAPTATIVALSPKGKAYIHVSDAKLEPLTKDKPMVLHVLVENTGTIESTGYFKDITCKFSDIEPRSLPYMSSEVIINFKLAPSEKVEVRLPFETVLDDWRLKMLNENGAELYFYARGDYWDEAGNKGELSFCRQYITFFPSYLAFCDENITFKESEAVNQ